MVWAVTYGWGSAAGFTLSAFGFYQAAEANGLIFYDIHVIRKHKQARMSLILIQISIPNPKSSVEMFL